MQYEKSCGAVVFTKVAGEIKYVIVQQSAGFHGYPKGHVESGETEEETALREIFEETGLKPAIIDGFRVVDEHLIPQKDDTMKQIVYFLAEYTDQEIKVNRTELLSIKLLSYSEAYDLFEFESSKRILKEANSFLTDK